MFCANIILSDNVRFVGEYLYDGAEIRFVGEYPYDGADIRFVGEYPYDNQSFMDPTKE